MLYGKVTQILPRVGDNVELLCISVISPSDRLHVPPVYHILLLGTGTSSWDTEFTSMYTVA